KGLKNCEFRVTFPQDFNEIIEALIELGFTSKEKINFENKGIETLDITSEIMERNLPKSDIKIKDKELIRVIFNSGKLIMDCVTASNNKYSAGVLDTAVPCSIIAQMLAKGFPKGVFPPEKIIPSEEFFKELKKRKIFIYKNGKSVN
ncbi:MAG: saccharopine dehydrogenase C-terminal domain-containing protein, partial [Nanoarchaeota archaeon]